ncbi:MAG: helix-turn-helix domain-containing protein [Candidatus Omnitrophica bacterium]|nr:helix-turn-helix domain-containing protein [Candidatus Omnitrophota bacterium]
MEQNRLVTVSEIAEILRVPKSWIYARTSMGPDAIPHVKIGKYVRFRVEEVLRFFENQDK